MEKQKTIKKEVALTGIGLHTAHKVNMTFKPATTGTGINFIRTDLATHPEIKVSVDALVSTSRFPRRTSIEKDGLEVQTIEHLMAALAGLGIDNINIELDNDEIPGLDGSSSKFLEILNKAGIVEQDRDRSYLVIREPIYAQEEGASVLILPSSEFRISYTLSYTHPLLKAQFLDLVIDEDTFEKEISPARTFCLESEANELQSQGFGKGANYENTLVVAEKGVIKNRLRYEDEFVRHKVLDLLGDLYILGQPIRGHVIALKSGHSLNLKLVRKLYAQKQKSLIGGIGSSGYSIDNQEVLDLQTIKKILPHREPFLFVDRITHLEKGKSARGIKNVTINDYFFKGHFPNRPVMPGVIMIEAMAQVGGVMMLASEENHGKMAFFMAADKVKFRKTVVPGDQVVLEAEAVKIKSKTGQVHTRALVDGKVVAEADLIFVLVEA